MLFCMIDGPFLGRLRGVEALVLLAGLSACGGGGGGGGAGGPVPGVQDGPGAAPVVEGEALAEPRALAIGTSSVSAGVPGDRVVLQVYGVDPARELGIQLGVDALVPRAEGENAVSFVVPPGARSGPLFLTQAGDRSNALWFSVSPNRVLPPSADQVVLDALGNRLATGHLLVSLVPGRDSREEAERLAALASGEVIGRIGLLRGWQLAVPADSLAALRAFAGLLEADGAVAFTVFDRELAEDAVDWSADPDRAGQRDRNRVEEAAALYQREVHPTEPGRHRPYFMSIGVSESGVDFRLPDFSGYAANGAGASGNVTLYAPQQDREDSAHGSNVTGVLAAELGDGGNAGLLRAVGEAHGGANLGVGIDGGSWGLGRLARTEQQLEAGSQVINWSWGVHLEGTLDCAGRVLATNAVDAEGFGQYQRALETFFEGLAERYPRAVIVSSAGNGATDAGQLGHRLPSALTSEQLLVVGAHTAGGTASPRATEDEESASIAATACFDAARADEVKRAWYSNYGQRVDIAASGTIMGLDNAAHAAGNRGTSYAAPLVAATVALMRSINPELSAGAIRRLLRASALPVVNEVLLSGGGTAGFTRPLGPEESPANAGSGARLDAEAAIAAALASVTEQGLPLADPVTVKLGAAGETVTRRVSVVLPPGEPLFDKVDIAFLVDVSVSYDDDIETFRQRALELTEAFASVGGEVSLALASFSDFPRFPFGDPGDYAFRLDVPLSGDFAAIGSGLDRLRIYSGSDVPESQLEALFQLSRADTGWTPGALPIVFLATDAPFHDADATPGYPGAGYEQALAALRERGIRVYGLQSGGAVDDVQRIAVATGGEAFELAADSTGIVEAVAGALRDTSRDVAVTLEPNGDFAGLVQAITPVGVPGAGDGDGITGVEPGDTLAFDVVFGRGFLAGSGAHTLSFRLRVMAEGVAAIRDVPVTVVLE